MMPKWLVVLIAVAAVVFLYNAAKDNGVGQTCAVTALGQKLCGEELSAWCDATDGVRDTALNDPTFGTPDESISEAQRICDEVR